MSETNKIQLSGGPDKTVTWICLEDGKLKVEYYDFSESAQRLFGNDIAYILTVNDMGKLYATIHHDQTALLLWMEQYFKSYFGIKQWLEQNGIDFHVDIEGWA